MRESEGSRRGQIYKGPGSDTIRNEGEFDALAMVETGAKAKVTFQSARVRKPLVAVSSLVDKGNLAVFDGESYILPGSAPEVAEIRKLISQISGKIPMHRDKGVYKMKNWKVPREQSPSQGFTRQGRR